MNNNTPKPQKKVAALTYKESELAPTVLASGRGYLADKILENSKDIPIIENKELVDELTKMDLGAYIPPELYEVVAQILLFVAELDKRESAND